MEVTDASKERSAAGDDEIAMKKMDGPSTREEEEVQTGIQGKPLMGHPPRGQGTAGGSQEYQTEGNK